MQKLFLLHFPLVDIIFLHDEGGGWLGPDLRKSSLESGPSACRTLGLQGPDFTFLLLPELLYGS